MTIYYTYLATKSKRKMSTCISTKSACIKDYCLSKYDLDLNINIITGDPKPVGYK